MSYDRRKKHNPPSRGTDLAFILVSVAIVVIAILLLLGPQIGNVFSRITNGIG